MSSRTSTQVSPRDAVQRGPWRVIRLHWSSPGMLALGGIIVVALVGAWQYRWICDDAMINFHIVDNFVHGHGPVFNVGERTEVYSDPLWVAALIVLRVVLWFVPLGWSAVLLGLACSALGFYFAGRAALLQRHDSTKTPWLIGLASLSVIPAMWEFMTSGLEIGMSLAWIGSAYYLIVRRHLGVGSLPRTAFVLGLGTLIRPDLLLLVLWFLLVWWLTDSQLVGDRTHRVRRAIALAARAFAVPVLYELFRMAYFASLVPNTGLVKSATSLWISQGITYLTNFFNPYWLWIPVALLVLTQVDHLVQLRHEQRRAILAAAPLLGGLVSMAYFVAIGGDFMHGRLLLPGLFCLVMNTAIEVNSLRRGAVVAGIVVWSVVCASALRWSVPTVLVVSINDERTVTVGLSDVAHPITPHDFAKSQWFGYGQQLRRGAEAYAPKHDGLVLGSNTKLFVALPDRLPPVVGGRNGLGNVLIAATRPIGQVGFAAGQHVYLFDQLSLANPVSSHFIVHERGKPGHEKVASMAWYLGRFGTPGDAAQLNRYRKFSDFERVTSTDVVAARAALSCGPLRRYLRGITAPLTPKLLVSNFLHSLSNTTMKFDANPVIARSELCGHN